MSNLLIENKKLMSEWNYKKNAEFDLNNITSGFSKKVWWKCNKGHEWEAVIHTRTKGVGCPYCSGHKVLIGYNDIKTTNPELIEEWDFEKNGELGYEMENYSKGNATKVWWKCSNGHSYQREVYNQRNGYGKSPICKSSVR